MFAVCFLLLLCYFFYSLLVALHFDFICMMVVVDIAAPFPSPSLSPSLSFSLSLSPLPHTLYTGEVFSKQSLKFPDVHKSSEKTRGKQKRRDRTRTKSGSGQKQVRKHGMAIAVVLSLLEMFRYHSTIHVHRQSVNVPCKSSRSKVGPRRQARQKYNK